MSGYIIHYPPEFSGTYVKATNYFSSSYVPWYSTNPILSTVDQANDFSWLSNSATVPIKFNIDLGSPFIISRIMIDNFHHAGAVYYAGVKSLNIYGSSYSTVFDNTVGNDLTNLTFITTISNILIHSNVNSPEPQFFDFINSSSYRYYIFIITENWGDVSYVGFRKIYCYTSHESLEIICNYYNPLSFILKEALYVLPFIKTNKFFTYSFINEKLQYTTRPSNTDIVLNLWNKGVLDIVKYKYHTDIVHIYDFPEFSTVDTSNTFIRRSPSYVAGNIRTNMYGVISGVVRVEGVLWPNALVRLYYNIDGMPISYTYTDENGAFYFNYLEVGKSYYSVIAYKDGFNALIYNEITAGGYTPPVVLPNPRPELPEDLSWSPEDITKTLWLDASDADTLVIDNGISSWLDKSDNGYNLSNLTSRPSTSSLNTKTVAVFDGDDIMWSDINLPIIGDPAISVYVVYKKTTDTLGHLFGWGSNASNQSFGLYDDGTNPQYAFYSASYNISLIPNNTWHISCVTKSASAGPMHAYRNSVLCSSSYSQPTSNIATSKFVLGRWANYSSSFAGQVAEFIIMSSTSRDPERFQIEGYLASKWGLLDSLPVTHPFKSGEMSNYISKFPLAYNSTYVKCSSYFSSTYAPENIFKPTVVLVGHFDNNCWLSSTNAVPQKICIDYDLPFKPKRIYIDNLHHFGNAQGHTGYGVKTINIYGTNSTEAFEDTVATNTTGLIFLNTITLREHIAQDLPDPQWFDITCEVSYRYIIFIITERLYDSYSFMGIRRIEVQSIGQ